MNQLPLSAADLNVIVRGGTGSEFGRVLDPSTRLDPGSRGVPVPPLVFGFPVQLLFTCAFQKFGEFHQI